MNKKDVSAMLKAYEEESKDPKCPYSYIDIAEHYKDLARVYEKYVSKSASIKKQIDVWRLLYRFPLKYYIYTSMKESNVQMLKNTLYQFATWRQIAQVHSGLTPELLFDRYIIYLLAACKKEYLKLVIPESWGLCKKIALPGCVFTNAFMAIWYDREDYKIKAISETEKYLTKKHTAQDIATAKYLLALLKKDTATATEQLNAVCIGQRSSRNFGETKFDRSFSIYAHGLYNLSCFAYDGQLAGKIEVPDQSNFYQDLAIYEQNTGFALGESIMIYEDSFSLINNLMKASPPEMVRTQPYINGQPWNVLPHYQPSKAEIEARYGKDYQVKISKDYFINCDLYNENVNKQVMRTL